MQQRILGVLLWVLLLPVFGVVRFLWWVLSVAAKLKPGSWLVLGGMVVVWETHGISVLQLRPEGIESVRRLILHWSSVAVGILVLIHGLLSPESRWLWHRRRRRNPKDASHFG